MNHYVIHVEPTDDRDPAVWSGDAINFLDACVRARRMFDTSLGESKYVPGAGGYTTTIRTYAETSAIIAALPLRVTEGRSI